MIKHLVKPLLESFTGNADSKGQSFPLVSDVRCVKNGQFAGFGVQLHMPATISSIYFSKTLAHERLGSTSSITVRGYLSLFSVQFSGCESRQNTNSAIPLLQ